MYPLSPLTGYRVWVYPHRIVIDMFGIPNPSISRSIPAVIMHSGQTAYHNQGNFIPCFYVIVPKRTWVDCHGGVTFGEEEDEDHVPGFPGIEVPKGYCVLGWDYAHDGDDDLTAEEIIEDVKITLEELSNDLS